jgi:hypothetical protein
MSFDTMTPGQVVLTLAGLAVVLVVALWLAWTGWQYERKAKREAVRPRWAAIDETYGKFIGGRWTPHRVVSEFETEEAMQEWIAHSPWGRRRVDAPRNYVCGIDYGYTLDEGAVAVYEVDSQGNPRIARL